MKFRRELKIGFYFAASLIALYWGFNFLKGRDIFGKTNSLYAVFSDVEGLQNSSQVFMKGLKVGTVKSINLDGNNEKFVVELQIKSDFNIPNNSVAHLYSADIMSNKAIRIMVGDSHLYFTDKDSIRSAVDSDITSMLRDQLLPLKQKVESLVDELNVTFKSINSVLDEKTTKSFSAGIVHLSGTLANLEDITGALNKSKSNINNIMANAESVSANLKNNNDKVTHIIDNFAALSDSLRKVEIARTVNELNKTLVQLNSGQGTMGKLMKDDSLYNNLSHTLKQLDLLLEDVRVSPKRYINISVFGKKQD